MWKVDGIKLESAAGWQKKSCVDTQLHEKWKFFVNRFVTENFLVKIFGTRTIGTATDSAFRISIWKGGRNFFYSILPAQSLEMLVERELPAILGRCSAKLAGHNFYLRVKSSWVCTEGISCNMFTMCKKMSIQQNSSRLGALSAFPEHDRYLCNVWLLRTELDT